RLVAADKDPAAGIAAGTELARPGPFDVQALLDRQLPLGQRDRLPIEAGIKDNRIPLVGGGDHRPQGSARPIIGGARDRERAEYSSIFEGLQPRHEPPWR